MTDNEFSFKKDCDMRGIVEENKTQISKLLGTDVSNIKCKGIRIFFVVEPDNMLTATGLFVKGFSPEDWDDEE
jgi:hypothetical protein